MSASKYCKEHGLKGVVHTAEIANMPSTTLHRWYLDKPELFKVVVKGCVVIEKDKDDG